tara:strand:+ start:304 stop:501 length:198 start_codon:yes stop_codon:yes gene_type:complete
MVACGDDTCTKDAAPAADVVTESDSAGDAASESEDSVEETSTDSVEDVSSEDATASDAETSDSSE